MAKVNPKIRTPMVDCSFCMRYVFTFRDWESIFIPEFQFQKSRARFIVINLKNYTEYSVPLGKNYREDNQSILNETSSCEAPGSFQAVFSALTA